VKAASPFEGMDRPSDSSVNLGLLVRAFTNILLAEEIKELMFGKFE